MSSYRIRMINGKEERQLLATDDYDPVNRIVKIGTKPLDGKSPAQVDPKKPPTSAGAGATQGTITLQGQLTKPQR